MPRTQIMSSNRVRRTLTRLAYEIVEQNRGADDLVVLGIRERGLVLAHQLVAELSAIENGSLRAEALEVRPQPTLPTDIQFDGRDVIVVDDVLFSGQTAWSAVETLVKAHKPESVQLCVLIDRGHRKYPIQPDFVGKTIPTKYREQIVVEVEKEIAVYLEE